MKTYTGYIKKLEPNQIFVFGSNPQGRHGRGAAATASKLFGAKHGQARGLQGQSYGIVTKDLTKRFHPSVPAKDIIKEIQQLYLFAASKPDWEFLIAYSGHGVNLNGYNNPQMAKMFASAPIPPNIVFENTFFEMVMSWQADLKNLAR